MIFVTSGDHNVYDVRGHYIDLMEPRSKPSAYNRIPFELGNIPTKTATSYERVSLDKQKGFSWNIFFSSRRGLYTQALRMKFVNGRWRTATHVSDFGRVLLCVIDEGYPIDNDDIEIQRWLAERKHPDLDITPIR